MSGSLRAFYFLYYGYVGASQGYLAPYLRGLGFTGDAIGAVTMAAQIASAVAGLLWAHHADLRDARETTLRRCALFAFCGIALFPFARTPQEVAVLLVAYGLFGGAVVPLADSVTMEWTSRYEGRSYARTRLFGSLGFIVVAQALGVLLTLRADRPADRLMPIVTVLAVLGYALVAQTLPRRSGTAGTSDTARHDFAPRAHLALPSAAVRILRDPSVLLLMCICLLHWAACAPYHLLYGVLVRDHGLPSSLTGLGLALGVLSEVLALFAFPSLLTRFSLGALLVSSSAGTVVRWFWVSRAHDAASIVGLQLLHGLTFGIWWAAAVEAMRRSVPLHLRATGQALFSALVFGAGNAIGYGLAGVGYQHFGSASPLFAIAAAVEIGAVALSALAAARLGGVRATNA